MTPLDDTERTELAGIVDECRRAFAAADSAAGTPG